MTRLSKLACVFVLAATSSATFAGGSYVPPPTKAVAAARLGTDQKTITTDKSSITTAQSAVKGAQNVIVVDNARLAVDRQQLTAGYALIKDLQAQLAIARGKNDLVTAAGLEGRIGAAQAAGAALEADIAATNAKMRADQAKLNNANEAVLMANRQLGLDTNQFNADTYYSQWGQ